MLVTSPHIPFPLTCIRTLIYKHPGGLNTRLRQLGRHFPHKSPWTVLIGPTSTKYSFFQEILRAGAPSRRSLRGGLAHSGRDSPRAGPRVMEGANTSLVGWGDAQQAPGLGGARGVRRQRKPPGSPGRSPALHQGLRWQAEQPPVNGRGRRRGGKAT